MQEKARMPNYRLLLFRDGEMAGKVDRRCADDIDAFETARALRCRNYAVEVYEESRLVVRLEQIDG